jgi:hypothetical protein
LLAEGKKKTAQEMAKTEPSLADGPGRPKENVDRIFIIRPTRQMTV